MRPPPPARGFSLVELLVAVAVGTLVALGSTLVLRGQVRAFQSTSAERATLEAARVALGTLAADLRRAGFGVDPALAFDFGTLASAQMAMGPAGASFPTAPLACDTGVTCRDRTDGPDEVVFLSRDPAFGKVLLAAATAASGTLTLQGPLHVALHRGQILQVLCYSGNMTWAYVTVQATVAASTASSVEVPIETASAGIFPSLNGHLADACFSTVATADAASLPYAARVFKVDRYRYFIRTYDETGGVVAWGTAGARPWLMLDRGLVDTTDGDAALIQPVAPDVEDLQAAYVFPLDEAAPVVGATEGVRLSSGAGSIDLSAASPRYGDALTAASRFTHHPANLRTVRVSLVVRSPEATFVDDGSVPAALNRPAVPGPAGHRRVLLETSVPIRNLDARAPYYPVHGDGTDQLNVGGG